MLRLQHETLNETIEDLRANKDAFCPNLWELHEFAFYGSDAAGSYIRAYRGLRILQWKLWKPGNRKLQGIICLDNYGAG